MSDGVNAFVPGVEVLVEGAGGGPLTGMTFATTNLEFKLRGQALTGRQSQTWIRLPDLGWKVAGAHVSTTDGKASW